MLLLWCAQKSGLQSWDDDENEEEKVVKNYIILSDDKFDVSKEVNNPESPFHKKSGKFYGCLGKDITICCAKDSFTQDYLGKGIQDIDVKLKQKEIDNLSKMYTMFCKNYPIMKKDK